MARTKAKVNEVQIEKEVIVMTKEQEMAKKVMDLVATGKTMEEALTAILADVKPASAPTGTDRVAYLATLDDVQELRRLIKSAFASASKARKANSQKAEDEATVKVKTGQKRLAEIEQEVTRAADPFSVMRAHNYEASAIVMKFLERLDAALEKKLALSEFGKLSKKKLSETISAVDYKWESKVLQDALVVLDPEEIEAFKTRASNGDQWSLKLMRISTLLSK